MLHVAGCRLQVFLLINRVFIAKGGGIGMSDLYETLCLLKKTLPVNSDKSLNNFFYFKSTLPE